MKRTPSNRKTKWPRGVAFVHIPFMPQIHLEGEGPFVELMHEIKMVAERAKKNTARMSAKFEIGTDDPQYGRTFTSEVTYHTPLPKRVSGSRKKGI